MRSIFRSLFTVGLRHSFYASGSSAGDFVVEPAPATRRALASFGLGFRRLHGGWTVIGEIEPEAGPPRLLRPLPEDDLRFVFVLRVKNPYLWNVSDLAQYQPGRSVFYWNNLYEDAEGLYLGDPVAAARVGAPLTLLVGESLTRAFDPAVDAATLTITDLFGNTAATASFVSTEAASEVRFDLAGTGLAPGRYTASDDHGGTEDFYYDPELFADRPFGVVEVLNRAEVPAANRFLDGDELTGTAEYELQLESRSTNWRYYVVKKYDANSLNLTDLSITGPVSFTPTLENGRVIFNSDDAVPLSESRQAVTLKGPGDVSIRELPNPQAATPLAAGAAPGSYVSEMYVYV